MTSDASPQELHEEAADNEQALGIGDVQDAGRFRLDLATGQWWWSDEIYAMHGFERGEVVPSTDLLIAHKHPEDATEVDHVLREAQRTGDPFSSVHRIVDSQGDVRTIAIVGQGRQDESGQIALITGYFVDLTGAQRRSAQQEATAAIEASAAHRGAIEQAKGVVVATFGGAPDAAFEVLREASNHRNARLRDVAAEIVAAASARPVEDGPLTVEALTRALRGTAS